MLVAEKVDWISATFPSKTPIIEFLPDYMAYKTEAIDSPIPVYKNAYVVHPLGIKVLFGDERLGIHVIMSGKVLDKMREHEIDDYEIYERIREYNGRLSRIDLAVDVEDCEQFTPQTVFEHHQEADTQFKQSKWIGEDETLETFYVGNIKSRSRKIRCYDKAIEQGIIDKYWTRIEYEKRRNADKTYDAIHDAKQSIRSIIKSVLDYPNWELYQEIMNTDKAIINRTNLSREKSYADKLEWICQTAVPALAEAYRLEKEDNPLVAIDDSVVFSTFVSALSAQLRLKKLI